MRYPLPLPAVALLLLLFVSQGCTTTNRVVESWRGYPIEEVVAQWGPPSSSDSIGSGILEAPPHEIDIRFDSRERAVHAGARTYTWEHTTHHYRPEYTKTVTRREGDLLISKSRVVPAAWDSSTKYFELQTDDEGRVVAGRCRDDLWSILGRYFAASNGKWGEPRREAD